LEGRVTAKINSDSSQTTYSYEMTTSRLKSKTDPNGQTTIYDYLPDDNVAQITYANAIVATPSVSFTYDPSYNRVSTMTDGTGSTVYAYNPITGSPSLGAGRIASVDGPLSNDTIN
jgi:YD repeat-containing protein